MLTYVHQFLGSLFFSVVIESFVALLLCLYFKKDKRISLIAALGTVGTIPYVWFVFPSLFWYSASSALYFGEGFAFLAEALLYRIVGALSWKQALIFSFIANCASYFLGRIF